LIKLREYLSFYLSDRIEYTGQRILNKDMEYTRHYYGYKSAKDFLMLHNKQFFAAEEIREMFESKALLNYMNDVIMHIIGNYN